MNLSFLKQARAPLFAVCAALWVTASAQAAPAELTGPRLAALGQSPIDITNADLAYYNFQKPVFTNTSVTGVDVFQTGLPDVESTVRANINDPFAINQVRVEGFNNPFQLLQLHMHAPSEHLFNGVESAMELHMVHKSTAAVGDPENGQILVVGRMVEGGGSYNYGLSPLLDTGFISTLPTVGWDVNSGALFTNGSSLLAPDNLTPVTPSHISLNLTSLIPGDLSSYRYDGGFTTMPYTQGVYWMIMAEPLHIPTAEIDAFHAMFAGHTPVGGNIREPQPLNGRLVYTDVPAIPEPETYMMMLVGLGLLGLIARARNRHTV